MPPSNRAGWHRAAVGGSRPRPPPAAPGCPGQPSLAPPAVGQQTASPPAQSPATEVCGCQLVKDRIGAGTDQSRCKVTGTRGIKSATGIASSAVFKNSIIHSKPVAIAILFATEKVQQLSVYPESSFLKIISCILLWLFWFVCNVLFYRC